MRDDLAARIVTEAELARMLSAEPDLRNHAALRLLYGAGLRVSELCALCWRDLAAAKPGGQATVFGKGGKTRAVLIQPRLWKSLGALRGPGWRRRAGVPLAPRAARWCAARCIAS